MINGVRTQQQSPIPVPTEGCESWASAPADADTMNLTRQRVSGTDGAGNLSCFDDTQEEGPRSASAPPCMPDDDWSISGFSEHQPKEAEALSNIDEFEDDGVFDIDL